jgi:hypothetical protein
VHTLTIYCASPLECVIKDHSCEDFKLTLPNVLPYLCPVEVRQLALQVSAAGDKGKVTVLEFNGAHFFISFFGKQGSRFTKFLELE